MGQKTHPVGFRLQVNKDWKSTWFAGDSFALGLEEDLKIRGSGDTLGAKQSGLPNFKLANLDVHQKLLELARNLSVETVKNDPLLKSPLGKAQKTLLHLFKNEVAIDYIKSG